jgi:hypothetical protein
MSGIDFQALRATHSLADVAGRYVELRRKGSEVVGLCPFHDDHNPSFYIYNGADGFERYRCFACGAGSDGGDVVDFMAGVSGVSIAEAAKMLSNGGLPERASVRPPKPKPDQSEKWRPIVPVPDDAPEYDPATTYNPKSGRVWKMNPARVDPYMDAAGKLICYVVRINFDDGAKMTPTVTWCEGPDGGRLWCTKRMPPPYPLQGLDELAARPKDAVLLVSGEKVKADCAKIAPAFVCMTWMGGDQAAHLADVAPLQGRYITYWPDADDSGRAAMAVIAKMMEK